MLLELSEAESRGPCIEFGGLQLGKVQVPSAFTVEQGTEILPPYWLSSHSTSPQSLMTDQNFVLLSNFPTIINKRAQYHSILHSFTGL